MTAVASPPSFPQHNRLAWGNNSGVGNQNLNAMNTEDLRMFMPRKSLQRTNSSSSVSSASSTSSTSTVATVNSQPNGSAMPVGGDLSSWPNPAARKRPQGKGPWPSPKPETQPDFSRMAAGRGQIMGGLNGSGPPSILPQMGSQTGMPRAMGEPLPASGQPSLYLLSLNGTFERKTISVPFGPDTLRIGRQTNQKTVPTPVNGFFDSKVLSRQHAEIWADRQGKIWIRDVKSSNGTFVNGTRLSLENRESEPHELQTGDHLELGIDIVSEDQKTVVHHKVAAKVEHAGFANPSSNLLDMNFGDLDPSNGGMMLQPQGSLQFRGRNGSQMSLAGNRMGPSGGMMGAQANGMGHQRGFFFSPISTEQIVKKLQNEMRTARLQTQDLGRSVQFVNTVLTKEDIKDLEKSEVSDPPKPPVVNGNSVSFRSDGKTRFSDPPAPPPSQPLPEKPDVPSLKRATTERPKSHPSNVSPIRQDGNISQILQLTEALNNAKKEIENQTSRMRDLEAMLEKERQGREQAEGLARRLKDQANSATNGEAVRPQGEEAALNAAFEPPAEPTTPVEVETPTSDVGKSLPEVEKTDSATLQLQMQVEMMVQEIQGLRQDLEASKQRADLAEVQRDESQKSLADMVQQIRRETEAREAAALEKARARASNGPLANVDTRSETSEESGAMIRTPSTGSSQGQATPPGEPAFEPVLSRQKTITPVTASGALTQEQVLAHGLPYASMIGVVLIGMGIMAYINGWQPQPRIDR